LFSTTIAIPVEVEGVKFMAELDAPTLLHVVDEVE
jgi:hypothetical protein